MFILEAEYNLLFAHEYINWNRAWFLVGLLFSAGKKRKRMRIKEVNKRKEKPEKEGWNQMAPNWKLELPPGMMFTNPGSGLWISEIANAYYRI